MFKDRLVAHRARIFAGLALTGLLTIAFLPSQFSGPVTAQQGNVDTPSIPSIPAGQAYRQTNLVSDVPGLASILDPLLVNPWGISATASSPMWVVNNRTSTTELLKGDVSGNPFLLNASPQTITIPDILPTGTVSTTGTAAGSFNFVPTGGGSPVKAAFLFDSITGSITAWAGAQGTTAKTVVSNPANTYTGLALVANAGGDRLYAADSAHNKIDVFDSSFTPIVVTGGFLDPTVPAGFNVFNIQNLGGRLYVTYAKPQASPPFVENGVGKGYVRRFDRDGVRDASFAIDGSAVAPIVPLDAPWGLAIAPASPNFGTLFGNALLVGNFSDNGIINAFTSTGTFIGTLKDESGNAIVNDQLWGLQFGNGGNGGDPNTLYFAAGIADEEHGLFGKLNATTASATSLVQFATDTFGIGEGNGHIDVSVTRAGDASGTATVNVNTLDFSQPGHASQKSDYEIAVAKVTFNPGETSKTVRILIVNDTFVEGNETVNLALSNPTGAGVGLGSPNQSTLTITDNDAVPPTTNPIDDANFFVRQQYLDFLNREPDTSGFNFWTNQITSCGADANCIAAKRVNVSAAFFLSIEFQNTGMLSYLANKAAFGNLPSAFSGASVPVLYGTFEKDVQALQKDFVVGAVGADAQLEANKQAYFNDFVNRPEFIDKFGAMTNAQYVDALLASAGIDPPNQRLFVVSLTNGQEVPPTVPTLSGGGARPASFGTAKFQFNAAQTAMTFTATINNIDVGGSQTTDTNDNLVNAHIHAGASVAPGVNGPVVWGFFGAPFNDNNPNDAVATPFSSGVGGNFSGKWDAPEGNGTTLAAQLTNLRTGHAYINFHTTQFGGGEIRGNFPAETAFRDALVAGLTGATETRATVLRKVAESEEFSNNEFTRAFVLMEYFGYLRRDPDTAGYNFWLNKLNAANGNFVTSDMVKSFLLSSEYRQRFGPA